MRNSTVPNFAPRTTRPTVANVRFTADELRVVDREADNRGFSRSDFIRVAVGQFVVSVTGEQPASNSSAALPLTRPA